MTRKIYKYSPPGILGLIFDRDGFCGIKCTCPKDYNDPYELFLSVDLRGSADLLATYREVVQDLPQYPTTCFSKAPTVSPMWAHYAENHTGFVLEFDAEAIEGVFEDVLIKDVAYRDDPDPDIAVSLMQASITKKARHAVWLQNTVIHQAYYSKLTPWQYEQECRLAASDADVDNVSGQMILFLPVECLSAIIVGSNASDDLAESSKEIAEKYDVEWLHSRIGKSTSLPFFTTKDGSVRTFKSQRIDPAENVCEMCSEPIGGEEERCPWCQITDEDMFEAAVGNPLRAMAHFGLLGNYMRDFEAIGRAHRRGRRKK